MPKAQLESTLNSLWIEKWEQATQKVTALAEALPEEKFESQLVAGARAPGEVLRHIAFWSQYLAAKLRG
ncbi:MAG TPA: DinB family protein [Bryobacteraceae bacterium]|nr:DinB family protein [Bryobacteraceae bacterium]